MQSGFERFHAQRGVGVMRRSDQHGIDRTGMNELLAGVESLKGSKLLELGGIRAGHGGQLTTVDLILKQVLGMVLAHVTQADNSDADFIHLVYSVATDAVAPVYWPVSSLTSSVAS